MNRLQIRQRFRQENPDVTERVLTDTVLNSWLLEGDSNFACETKIIQESGGFSSVIGEDQYDLTSNLERFLEIDELSGGGVAYDGKRIDLTTKSALDNEDSSWRSRSNGIPKKYYRRGKYLFLDRPSSAVVTIDVDYAAVPEDFDNDDKEPFNQLAHLKPYHYTLVLYLKGRSKLSIGKDTDGATAMLEYESYVKWCKSNVQGGKLGPIQFKPVGITPSHYRR